MAQRTGLSMHCRSCCSNAAHVSTGRFVDEAQQAVPSHDQRPSLPTFSDCEALHAPRTELMMLMHGFSSNLFGRRTRSLGRGGRRVGARTVEPPLAGIVA